MFEIGGSLRGARLKRNLTPADIQKTNRIREPDPPAPRAERRDLHPAEDEAQEARGGCAPDPRRPRRLAWRLLALGPLGQREWDDRIRSHACAGQDAAGQPE